MNKYLIATLLILNIAFSQALFLKKPNTNAQKVFAQLQQFDSSELGKRIMDTIALQLENKSPLSDVAKMLADLRTDVENQQTSANELYSSQVTQCNTQLANYEQQINFATYEITDSSSIISTNEKLKSELETDIAQKTQQIADLNQQLNQLRDERLAASQVFATRQADGKQGLEALDLIIEKFSTIQPEQEQQAALAQLAKIGKSNPIKALLQVASTFNAETLANVQGKLQTLRDSIALTLVNEDTAENQAIATFNNMERQLLEQINQQTSLKQESETRLAETVATLAAQNKRRDAGQQLLADSQEGKASTESRCAKEKEIYETETAQRSTETQLIQQIEVIIATKLETMKDYLKERA